MFALIMQQHVSQRTVLIQQRFKRITKQCERGVDAKGGDNEGLMYSV